MIAVDINLVIRLLVGDDPKQEAEAVALLKRSDLFLTDTVILETVWVLQSFYHASREDIASAMADLLDTAGITIELATIRDAVEWYRRGMDFEDATHLVAASRNECHALATFDKRFSKRAVGLTNCKVLQPEQIS